MTITIDRTVVTADRLNRLDVDRRSTNPWLELPARLHGKVIDCDSHLILNAEETFRILGPGLGETMRAKRQAQYAALDGLQAFSKDDSYVWKAKGTMAHGSRDARQRVEVLDEMGVHRQILFGSGMANIFWGPADLAYPAARRFNEFAAEWSSVAPDRLLPAGIVNCQDPERAIIEAEHAIAIGLRAIQLAFYPDFQPSPDSGLWEPLWKLLNDRGVPALIHWDMRWSLIEKAGEVSHLHVRSGQSVNENGTAALDPTAAKLFSQSKEAFEVMPAHQTPEKFLTSLALSGVFERFPNLRIGVFECTSFWVGPWLERLDALQQAISGKVADAQRLSNIVKLALRVTPLYGEPFGRHLELHGLQDVFVFASDYPHPEGGIQPLQEVNDQCRRSESLLERVLVTNAGSIFPTG